MSKSQIYPLTKRAQLIDLNGDNVNFKLDFQVKALDPDHEFKAIVLTQEQLDSIDLNKIEMKHAKGNIQGNITANNDKYQNYFLVLKKNDVENNPDFNVEVIINLEKIEQNNTTIESNNNLNNNTTVVEELIPQPKPFYKKPIFWLGIVIVLIIISYYAYKYFIKKEAIFGMKPILSSTTSGVLPTKSISKESAISKPVDLNLAENQLYNSLQQIAEEK